MKKFYYFLGVAVPIALTCSLALWPYEIAKSYGMAMYLGIFIAIFLIKGRWGSLARGVSLGLVLSLVFYWFAYYYLLRGTPERLGRVSYSDIEVEHPLGKE